MVEGNVLIWNAARVAHEANRVLCLALGDNSQPAWDDAPEWQKLSEEAGVEKINAFPDTTPQQSHEGWIKIKEADGWKYGPAKNTATKEHPDFVPYNELPESQRLKNEMFVIVVKAALHIF